MEKGRSGTDANGPFRGLAKHQQKQYFPNDHARVHASPCSRHVTRSHMIKDRHGTLTAPRRDNGTQTKRETDQLCSSIGFWRVFSQGSEGVDWITLQQTWGKRRRLRRGVNTEAVEWLTVCAKNARIQTHPATNRVKVVAVLLIKVGLEAGSAPDEAPTISATIVTVDFAVRPHLACFVPGPKTAAVQSVNLVLRDGFARAVLVRRDSRPGRVGSFAVVSASDRHDSHDRGPRRELHLEPRSTDADPDSVAGESG